MCNDGTSSKAELRFVGHELEPSKKEETDQLTKDATSGSCVVPIGCAFLCRYSRPLLQAQPPSVRSVSAGALCACVSVPVFLDRSGLCRGAMQAESKPRTVLKRPFSLVQSKCVSVYSDLFPGVAFCPWAAATTCEEVTYTFETDTDCGKIEGSSFVVKRCAKSNAEVVDYLKVCHVLQFCMRGSGMFLVYRLRCLGCVLVDAQKQSLGANLKPDNCKLAWLAACATFPLPGVVVVPKRIQCNKEMCNQGPFYSNCGKSPLHGS